MPIPPERPTRARRTPPVVLLTTAVLLCGLAAPAALADSPAPTPSAPGRLPAGLFGGSDPTYDGVFRQATALLALDAVKTTPPAPAVGWLIGQQCADGGFGAFRANTATPCKAGSEDTNSTGLAVQALARGGGHDAVVSRAVRWLRGAQNKDGGWGYQPGTASDTDSTTVVAGALAASGTDPAKVAAGGRSPVDALVTLQLGCAAKAAGRGAFAYQAASGKGGLTANDKATTDGVLGVLGSGYLVSPPHGGHSPKTPDCSSTTTTAASEVAESTQAGAAYLVARLTAGGQHLTTAQPGSTHRTPDYGTTADAVIALAAAGDPADARKPYAWLVGHGTGWAKGSPAGLGSLILAATAVGADPHDFGGTDLVRQLSATGPRPSAALSPSAGTSGHGGTGSGVWWAIGVGLLAGAGIGGAFSLRKRKPR